MSKLLPFYSIPLFVSILFTISKAEERSPHGIAFQNPMAISPEAYNFFHPDTQTQYARSPCSSSKCSTLPVAATVQSTPGHESVSTTEAAGRRKLRASGIAATITIAVVSVFLVGIGGYHLVITRRNNAARSKAVSPLKPSV